MAENRICITGLRRSKVPAVRAPLLSLFAALSLFPTVLCAFSPFFLSLSRSRRNGIVMIARASPHDSRLRPPSPTYLPTYLPFTRTLKPHCNVLPRSHERLGECASRRAASSRQQPPSRQSNFASSSFVCSNKPSASRDSLQVRGYESARGMGIYIFSA